MTLAREIAEAIFPLIEDMMCDVFTVYDLGALVPSQLNKLESVIATKLKERDVRESVRWFAREMKRKLAMHDEDRGPDGWAVYCCEFEWLEARLAHEVRELFALFPEENTVEVDREEAPAPERVISEAADVANFALMIADRARARLGSPGKEEVTDEDGSN